MLARIAVMGGVEGYVIVDSEGAVLRQSKGMNNETAAKYGMEMMRLTQKARHVVRDLDPSVSAARASASWGRPTCLTKTTDRSFRGHSPSTVLSPPRRMTSNSSG